MGELAKKVGRECRNSDTKYRSPGKGTPFVAIHNSICYGVEPGTSSSCTYKSYHSRQYCLCEPAKEIEPPLPFFNWISFCCCCGTLGAVLFVVVDAKRAQARQPPMIQEPQIQMAHTMMPLVQQQPKEVSATSSPLQGQAPSGTVPGQMRSVQGQHGPVPVREQFQVTVPPGCIGGSQLAVTTASGRELIVTVPMGLTSGDVFIAE